MKSCLGLLMTLIILVGVIGSGVAIWYLSTSTEITKKPAVVSPAR